MQTAEIKKKIIDHLEFADQRMLKMIYALLEVDSTSNVYDFSDAELSLIEEAENDIKIGNLLSNEQVEKQVSEWLSSQK
jgi:hypothetical protein